MHHPTQGRSLLIFLLLTVLAAGCSRVAAIGTDISDRTGKIDHVELKSAQDDMEIFHLHFFVSDLATCPATDVGSSEIIATTTREAARCGLVCGSITTTLKKNATHNDDAAEFEDHLIGGHGADEDLVLDSISCHHCTIADEDRSTISQDDDATRPISQGIEVNHSL